MLNVLLCGASDTGTIIGAFQDEIRSFGGDPWHYQSGHIVHSNSMSASFEENSRMSVRRADVCVFVLIDDTGEITWNIELREALKIGKPFILLCSAKAKNTYEIYKKTPKIDSILNDDQKRQYNLLSEFDSYNLTPIVFDLAYFREILRRELSNLFSETLKLLEAKNKRASIIYNLKDSVPPTSANFDIIKEIALDETEEKLLRKKAIRSLCLIGIDNDSCIKLLSSSEEGVQRLSVLYLDKLCRNRPHEEQFFSDIVSIANASDEVGVIRRMAAVLLEIDLELGLRALLKLEVSDLGTRRRVITSIEKHFKDIENKNLQQTAKEVVERYKENTDNLARRCDALLTAFELPVPDMATVK